MKNRMFLKLFVTISAALIVGFIMMFILLSIFMNNYLVTEKRSQLIDNCKTISDVLSHETENTTGFYISVNGVVEVVSRSVSGSAYVSDETGHVFFCSCDEWKHYNSCAHSKVQLPEKVLKKAADGYFFEVGDLDDRFEKMNFTAATPLYSPDGRIVGYVFISSPASLLEAIWTKMSKIFLVSVLIPVVILFVYLFYTSKRLVSPIKTMSVAAKRMADGDFSVRIPVRGNDEITELSEAFNAMSNSLSQLDSMRRSFVANVSHELRTPMTTIGGFIDGILDGTIPKEKEEYYLGIVSGETKRLSRLVQSMLSLSRLESGEQKVSPTNFRLTELAGEILISQEQRIINKDISVTGLENGEDIYAYADRDLIYQAVYNLVDNAIKFTPDGGAIEVTVSEEASAVRLKIRNTGKGIPPDELQYVFERFYKTDKARSENKNGTGLGLYIVKTVIDVHKGTVTVRSRQNEYTEFEITIPKGCTQNGNRE